jgi:hypothetical protein
VTRMRFFEIAFSDQFPYKLAQSRLIEPQLPIQFRLRHPVGRIDRIQQAKKNQRFFCAQAVGDLFSPLGQHAQEQTCTSL